MISGEVPVARSLARRPQAAFDALNRRWPGALWWLPVALAAFYGIVVLADFREITAWLSTSSDNIGLQVIAPALGSGPASLKILIGDSRCYEPLTYLWATHWLPLHRQLWDATPLLCDLGGVALLAWSARRVFGRWPAALSAAALICVGRSGLVTFLTFGLHGATAIHVIVLGAALVFVASRAATIPRRRLAVVSIALGLFSAAAVPDTLFLIWGLVPFLAAAALIAWRATGPAASRLLGFAVATAAVALVAGSAFAAVLGQSGVSTFTFPLTLAAGNELGPHFVLMLEGLTGLAGGDFFGLPASFVGLVTFVTGALVLLALALVLIEVRRRAALAGPRGERGLDEVTARRAYVSFWSICLVSTVGAFIFGTGGENLGAGRYLLGAYLAVAALLPLLAERGLGARLSLAAGVSLLAAIATYQLVSVPINPQGGSPSTTEANALERFAKSHGVKYGYAGYWDSLTFTWQTNLGVDVFPVAECGPGPTLCPFSTVHVSSWYTPRPNTPSFLLVDHTQPFVTGPDPLLGKPIATATIDHLQVYVYPYDIASRLAHHYGP